MIDVTAVLKRKGEYVRWKELRVSSALLALGLVTGCLIGTVPRERLGVVVYGS